jgi:hypothetical protein
MYRVEHQPSSKPIHTHAEERNEGVEERSGWRERRCATSGPPNVVGGDARGYEAQLVQRAWGKAE